MREYSYLLHFADDRSNDVVTAVISTPLDVTEDAFKILELLGVEWVSSQSALEMPKLTGKQRMFWEPYFVFGYCREDRTTFSNFGAIAYAENAALFFAEGTYITGNILSMSYPQAKLDGEEVDIPGYRNRNDEEVELNQLDIWLSDKNAEIASNAIARLNVIVDTDLCGDEKSFIKIRRSRSVTLKDFGPIGDNVWLKNWDSFDVSLAELSSLWRARLHFAQT